MQRRAYQRRPTWRFKISNRRGWRRGRRTGTAWSALAGLATAPRLEHSQTPRALSCLDIRPVAVTSLEGETLTHDADPLCETNARWRRNFIKSEFRASRERRLTDTTTQPASFDPVQIASGLYPEKFLRISERDFFLGFTWQIDGTEPVGSFLHVHKRVVGGKHHSVHADVLQQEIEQFILK